MFVASGVIGMYDELRLYKLLPKFLCAKVEARTRTANLSHKKRFQTFSVLRPYDTAVLTTVASHCGTSRGVWVVVWLAGARLLVVGSDRSTLGSPSAALHTHTHTPLLPPPT